MKKYLVVTIDVEPDCSPNWRYSDPLVFRGVYEGIAKVLQPLFIKYGIVPTYLINNVVLEDAASTAVLSSLPGKYELGTHLHPEFIEPEKTEHNYAGKKGIANCCFYPPAIETAKIRSITELFSNTFGYQPKTFRAGRFSAGENTMRSLENLGYLVDTSVTPHIRWEDKSREKPVDYTKHPEQPYFDGGLLQVPVSIALKKRNAIKELLVSGAGLRKPYRKHKAVWLRPFYSDFNTMKFIVDQYSQAYQDREHVVFNMMFHNVEVLPGLSPYSITAADCEKYLQTLEQFFAYWQKNNFHSTGLSELYHVFNKK